jgi:hypothetical protein
MLVLFALVVALVPPVALWIAGLAARAVHPTAGTAVHLVTASALVGLATIQGAKSLGLDHPLLLGAVALSAAAAGAVVYARSRVVGTWVRATAILPFLALGVFLLGSGTGDLLSPPRAAASPPGGAPAPVVLLMLDEFPTKSILDESGRIDAARFPNLAAFAGDATWYRRYTTLAPLTEMAIPSVLSGREPTLDDPVAAAHPDTLFSLLSDTHELRVVESATALCAFPECHPQRLGDLVDRTLDLWRERVSLSRAPSVESQLGQLEEDLAPVADEGRGATRVRQRPVRFEAVLHALGPSRVPTLTFLHLMLPHVPWTLHEDGTKYTARLGDGAPYAYDRRNRTPWLAALAEQRHLLQAEYTDRLVGILLDRLREVGTYDESLVVVTADHGASFESGTNLRLLSPASIDSVAYAPLLIKAPGQAVGRVDDANVMSFDVLPTIAELLDVRIGWHVDGAPAGSAEVAARGTEKHVVDVTSIFAAELRGVLRFDGADRFPRAADRWIGPVAPGDDRLAGLHALLDLDGVIGRRLDDLHPARGGTAEIDALDRLERPAASGPRVGVVTGRVPGAPDGARVAVAVDGTVVTGSAIYSADGDDGRFAAILPLRALRAERRVLRLALVAEDGTVTELDVVAR